MDYSCKIFDADGVFLCFVYNRPSGDIEYIIPLIRSKNCPNGYDFYVCNQSFCEAEATSEFVETLIHGLPRVFKRRVFSVVGEISEIKPFAIDSTNPLFTLVSKQTGKEYVLKGYRKYDPYNFEPNFYEYLSPLGLTPPLVMSYYCCDVALGLLTRKISNTVDSGSFLYASALKSIKLRSVCFPTSFIKNIAKLIFMFHKRMFLCRFPWCGVGSINRVDVKKWLKRIKFYMKNIKNYSNIRLKKPNIWSKLNGLYDMMGKPKIRIHQDLHFSQILYSTGEKKFYIIDFEGEPGRPYSHKGLLEPPVRDLATVLRALDYIAFFALKNHYGYSIREAAQLFIEGSPYVELLSKWAESVSKIFLEEYASEYNKQGSKLLGEHRVDWKTLKIWVNPWILERALYEVYYEALYREKMIDVAYSTLLYRLSRF